MERIKEDNLNKLLFNSFKSPMFIVDIDTYEVLITNPVAKLLSEGKKGKSTCHALTHDSNQPCHTSEHPCPIKILRETRKPVIVEHLHHDKNGNDLYVEVHCHPIFDKDGKITKALEYHIDITGEKEAKLELKKINEEILAQKEEIKHQNIILEEQLGKLDIAYEQIRNINKKLIEKEYRYRKLADLTMEGIIIHRKGIVIDMNNAFLRIINAERKDILGKNLFEIAIPEKYKALVSQKIQEKFAEPYEIEAIRTDGILIPVEIESRNVEYGEESFRVSAVRDLTEKKRIEKQIRSSEDTIQLHHDLSNAFLFSGGSEVYNNILEILLKKFSSNFGLFGFINQGGDFEVPSLTYDIWDKCNIKDKKFIFPPEQWGGIWGETLKKKIPILKNSGLTVPAGHIQLESALCCPVIFKDKLIGEIVLGNKPGGFSEEDKKELEEISGYIAPVLFSKLETEQNIKLRVQTEERLKLSEIKYRDLLEALGEGVGIVDSKEDFIYVNDKGAEIFGVSKKELTGKNLSEFLDEDAVGKVRGETKERSYGKSSFYELSIIRKDGEKRILLVTGSPRYDLHGTFIGTLGIFRDITERKKMEQDLIDARIKAETSDKLKSAFLANMSHEIRTPLNGILGFTDLLKEHSLPVQEKNDYISYIQDNGTKLLRIINDIIDLSRIESGDLSFNEKPCRLSTMIEELFEEYRESFEKRGKENLEIILECHLEDIADDIMIDQARLRQVLSNLIENAIKFTEKGYIKLGCKRQEKHLSLYVEDTGIGFSADQQEMIFERFRQVDESNTRKYGGTGLGLAISKAIIDKMGGSIHVESQPGKGSLFHILLPYKPLIKQRKKLTPMEMSRKKYGWHDKTIMIVDDELSVLQFLEIVLSKTGAKIIRAENGESAFNLFLEAGKNVDLILMDMRMPGKSGFETTRAIKEIAPDVPVIAQTAYAYQDDPMLCINAGCDDYISKPILPDKLLELCKKYLG